MEQLLCEQIAYELRQNWPSCIFHFDYGSGARLTMGQAIKQKRLNAERGWPDLLIAEPRHGYSGLFIEVKVDGTRVWLRDGSLAADGHLVEQNAMHGRLRKRGYAAEFGIGLAGCMRLITAYLDGMPDEFESLLSAGSRR